MNTEAQLRLHPSIAEIGQADWDACAGTEDPFLSYAFLSALEDSGSASAATGWLPQHMSLRTAGGTLLAVAPCYAKSHSYGEYVFDHGWANAFARAGGDYYPKLQVAIPFSPVSGRRLLLHPNAAATQADAANALMLACQGLSLSSAHVTFCNHNEWEALTKAGWLPRLGTQFHFQNENYTSFEDVLARMASRKRKAIRRERRDANDAGLRFETLRGDAIGKRHWDAFFRFYRATVDRKWGAAYLNRKFFTLLGERVGDRIVLMMAFDGEKPVAGALNLLGDTTLYGRNWGCIGDWPFLHFELCYYRAIDFAIEHNLARVEAGAQGEHKIQRGYLPSPTYSAHWIEHPGLRRAIAEFLTEEREELRTHMAALAELSPFRQEAP